MQFEIAYLPVILLTGIVYLSAAAGLLKNNIRQLYSRRTKREKFLTIGVMVFVVVMMLFVIGRLKAPVMEGGYSDTLYNALLWLLGGSTDLLAFAAYLLCALPVIVISAGILDEFAQKHALLEIPYFFYVLLFAVEGLFYKTTDTAFTGWFLLLLFSTALYSIIKMHVQGADLGKKLLLGFTLGIAAGMCFLQPQISAVLLVRYAVLMGVNTCLSVVLNRSSVLKKKIWLLAIAVCYGLAALTGMIV